MPGVDGCAVLREIRGDPDLRSISVIIFSLAAREEFDACYRDQANACTNKAVDYDGILQVVRSVEQFWFHTAQLSASPALERTKVEHEPMTTADRPRILLAEDEALIRYTLRRIVEKQCEVVGEAADGQEAVDLTRELHPDIVLMDVSMPRLRGFDAARIIRQDSPEARIIMVSCHSEPIYVEEAFRVGARGFVFKASALVQLPQAIRSVMAGGEFRPD